MLAPAMHPNNLFLMDANVFVLLLLIAWGVGTCVLGYPLFRPVVAVYGVLIGVAAGWDIAHWARSAPSGMDLTVAIFCLTVLMGLIAWFSSREFFAVAVVWLVTALVASLFGAEPGRVGWAAGGLLGIGCGVLAWSYVRPVAILASGATGAVTAVYAATMLVLGGGTGEKLVEATLGPGGRPWLGFLLLLIAAALAGGGMFLQSQLADAVGDTFMPKARRRRRGDGRRGSTDVQPRFSKL